MATAISTSHAIAVKKWNDEAFREYVDKLVLKPYMGTSSESVIHVKEELAKSKGDRITFSLASKLSGAGVSGSSSMEGSEESMNFYGYNLSLDEFRNAVKDDGTLSRQRAPYELVEEFKPALSSWMAQKMEDKAFEAFAAIDQTAYASASESAKDAYLVLNSDRMLFGAAVSNNAGNDHSACLSEIDSTNDVLNTAQISLAKRLAQLANPKIRPIRLDNGEEVFVMFVHPYCARDLKNTDPWKNAQQYARERGAENPIFTGMLGMWDGVILKESPKVLLLDNVGASSSDVAVNVLCGAQALCYLQGGYPEHGGARVVMTEKEFDYGNQHGVQIKSMWQIGKSVFNSKQHGIVTVYSSAVAD